MLHLQIDPHSGVPVYRQVMDQVRYHVAAGALRAGDRLPSIRELARALAVNPTTVVKAYTELQHAGAIEMIQGKGAFVADAGGKATAAERRRALARLARPLAVEAVQMGADEATALEALRQEIQAIRRRRADEESIR